jgi:hypothetical protein
MPLLRYRTLASYGVKAMERRFRATRARANPKGNPLQLRGMSATTSSNRHLHTTSPLHAPATSLLQDEEDEDVERFRTIPYGRNRGEGDFLLFSKGRTRSIKYLGQVVGRASGALRTNSTESEIIESIARCLVRLRSRKASHVTRGIAAIRN